jgi:hypothetical protein
VRTDTQRLDWILAALDSGNGEPFEQLQAAYTLELRGRAALDAAMGAKVVEPGEPMPALTAIDMAVAELGRIRNVKGFSEERDDKYVPESGEFIGPLTMAALAYFQRAPSYWPWNPESFKPSPDDRKKELTKGIALALCELDRLIRAERRAPVTVGVDLANGPDQCVVDGVLQPQPREFKVGDRVRIVKKAAGVGYAWDGRMDVTIGNLGEIIEATETPSTLEPQYRVGLWYYLADSLEHVDE